MPVDACIAVVSQHSLQPKYHRQTAVSPPPGRTTSVRPPSLPLSTYRAGTPLEYFKWKLIREKHAADADLARRGPPEGLTCMLGNNVRLGNAGAGRPGVAAECFGRPAALPSWASRGVISSPGARVQARIPPRSRARARLRSCAARQTAGSGAAAWPMGRRSRPAHLSHIPARLGQCLLQLALRSAGGSTTWSAESAGATRRGSRVCTKGI